MKPQSAPYHHHENTLRDLAAPKEDDRSIQDPDVAGKSIDSIEHLMVNLID